MTHLSSEENDGWVTIRSIRETYNDIQALCEREGIKHLQPWETFRDEMVSATKGEIPVEPGDR
jgi:hypothetical protein